MRATTHNQKDEKMKKNTAHEVVQLRGTANEVLAGLIAWGVPHILDRLHANRICVANGLENNKYDLSGDSQIRRVDLANYLAGAR
jgi:hypothetical protein